MPGPAALAPASLALALCVLLAGCLGGAQSPGTGAPYTTGRDGRVVGSDPGEASGSFVPGEPPPAGRETQDPDAAEPSQAEVPPPETVTTTVTLIPDPPAWTQSPATSSTPPPPAPQPEPESPAAGPDPTTPTDGGSDDGTGTEPDPGTTDGNTTGPSDGDGTAGDPGTDGTGTTDGATDGATEGTTDTTTDTTTETTTSSPPADGTADAGEASASTWTAAPAPNTAPKADLDAEGTSGMAPLVVRFEVKASDPDGDLVTWTFDADGDGVPEASGSGTEVKEELSWTYTSPGDYVATLQVHDGTETSVDRVLVTVSAAEPVA